ncbi:MAG: nitrile hydratase accessory protein [Pseudomonadota bacterium]
MFAPEDPLAPPSGTFSEPWQANILAMATAMVRAGHISQTDWAEALGAALKTAAAEDAPDTEETYFLAALSALESLMETAGVTADERTARKSDWQAAYKRTPHGQPVEL